MKVVAEKTIKHNKKYYKPGEIIEVDEKEGKRLIEQGAAKPVPGAEPEKKK